MKKQRNTQYLCFLLFLVSLCACSKEANEPEGPRGLIGEACISISFSLPQTYAADADHATPEETNLKNVNIYVYADSSPELSVTFNAEDFEPLGDNIWRLKESRMISCTPGTKTIYAGINLPEKYRDVFSSSDNNPAQQITALNELNREENGFAMFSRKAVSVPLTGGDTASVVIPVERLLAKIAVFDAIPTYTLEGDGTFSALQYDVYNNNTRFYLLRNTDEYLDPNYDQAGWQAGNYKGQLLTGTGFIPVEKDPLVYNNYRNVKYTLENSTEVYKGNTYSKLLETATYVVISTAFHPEKVTMLTDGNWLQEQPNTTQPGTTFYRITYTKGTSEYVVAGSLEEVQAYALQISGGQTSQISKIETYKNGRCYYAAFLDEKRNHDIRRNHFYRLYVNGFAGLGSPAYPGESVNPGKPGEPKPDPEPDEALLLITVTLTDWYDDPEEWIW